MSKAFAYGLAIDTVGLEEVFEPDPAGECDVMGTRRGACGQCNACPGYVLPRVRNVLNNPLALCCRGCGCEATAHEDLGGRARRAKGDVDDDVTKRKLYAATGAPPGVYVEVQHHPKEFPR